MEKVTTSSGMQRSRQAERIGLICTVIMVAMAGVGGVLDLTQFDFPLQHGIGMPHYLAYILGIAKVLAVATFLTRRVPTLREWAYAGLTFELLGAVACHLLSHAPIFYAIPALFDWSFVLASYLLWQRVPKRGAVIG